MPRDPLPLQTHEVAAAEADLTRVRAKKEAAAKHLGISSVGLFGDSMYVARTTAERWEARARQEGRQEIIDAMANISRAAHEGRWKHLHGVNLGSLRKDAK
jgi:ribonuclease HI